MRYLAGPIPRSSFPCFQRYRPTPTTSKHRRTSICPIQAQFLRATMSTKQCQNRWVCKTSQASFPSRRIPRELLMSRLTMKFVRRGVYRLRRRRLLNRRPDAAMKLIADAESIVRRLQNAHQSNGKPSPLHQLLFEQIQATKDVNQLYSGFRDHVLSSSQKLGGGQQLKIGESYVALVSVTNTNVPNRNVRYDG